MTILSDCNEAFLAVAMVAECLLAACQLLSALNLLRGLSDRPSYMEHAYEFALVIHLTLNALLARATIHSVMGRTLYLGFATVPIVDALWANALVMALGLLAAYRTRNTWLALRALALLFFIPPVAWMLAPVWSFVLLMDCGLFTFRVVASLLDARRRSRAATALLSCMDATDVIAEGLLLYDDSGRGLFANDAMRVLAGELGLSLDLGDCRDVWGVFEKRAIDRTDGHALMVDMGKSGFWQLMTDKGTYRRMNCRRIVAINVTEEVRVNQTLRRQSELLKKTHDDLKTAMREIDAAANNEALLYAHARVHDVLGQRLSILHRRLSDGLDVQESWKIMSELLSATEEEVYGVSAPTQAESLAALIGAFEFAGIEFEVRGELPEDDVASGAFIKLVREASTNAILHGEAHRVLVTMDFDEKWWYIKIMNDGLLPSAPIEEHGGLSSMRHAVYDLGGTFALKIGPVFEIAAEVPRERG